MGGDGLEGGEDCAEEGEEEAEGGEVVVAVCSVFEGCEKDIQNG